MSSRPVELTKEFRGIPRHDAEAAIRKVFPLARPVGDGFEGEDAATSGRWTITLEDLPSVSVGSLEMGRLRFVLSGGAETVERVWAALAPGFLRGGG